MRLEVFPPQLWAGGVADEWSARLADEPDLCMCLPTGGTPRPLYAEMAGRGADLSRVEVFILDEFAGLPPGDPARCDAMIQRDLFDRLERSPAVVHSLDPAAADLEAEAERYGAAADARGLDLTLLGLGRNGHVALNEPGSMSSDRARVVALHPETVGYAAELSATPAEFGLTLGLGNILDSGEVWLLVTGAAKAEMLAQTLLGPIGPDVPASFLRDHDAFVVYADEPAAQLL